MSAPSLNEATMAAAVKQLCVSDPVLARVIQDRGPPPFWTRSRGWQTLVRIILEQQVSLASGRSAFRRLRAGVSPFSVTTLAATSLEQLRGCGLTRQKAGYVQGLARHVADGDLNLSVVARQQDDEARAALCSIRGIGQWTADCYLLFALRRPDVWPPGDLALLRGIEDLYRTRSERRIARLLRTWQPWRAVAARILWHDYLERRRRM
ncbi:MAG: DNA-3-methyladenine glycosylase 2 family protein [Gammaproteobacteria bacterium]|nr:DNA-3-methyladenine glycosylase 2 family protein [Gammaproteobacteria bacterium]